MVQSDAADVGAVISTSPPPTVARPVTQGIIGDGLRRSQTIGNRADAVAEDRDQIAQPAVKNTAQDKQATVEYEAC